MSDSTVLVSVITDEPLLARGVAAIVSGAPGMRMAEEDPARGGPVADVALLHLAADVPAEALTALLAGSRAGQVVLWAGDLPGDLAAVAVLAGVRGILRRQATAEEVVRCLRRVAAGELWLEARWLNVFQPGAPAALTRRERELLALITQGKKNKEIAYTMRIGEGTVKTYLSKLFRKVGVDGRFELACYGLQRPPHSPVAGLAA